MWIQKKIREDLDNLYPNCLSRLCRIETIPHEKAIKIVSYLWEGCFQSSNDIWIIVCSGLLYKIPVKWIDENMREIIDIINIDWNNDFDFRFNTKIWSNSFVVG